MDGSQYISLLESTYGSRFGPGDDWTSEELAWQLKRSAQLGGRYKEPAKKEVLAFSKRYVRDVLLQPISEALSDETSASIVKNLPVGMIDVRALNAQALRAPNGDPVILFNGGILQIISHWWETQFVIFRRHVDSGRSADETDTMRELLDLYSFVLLMIESNGRLTYPQPMGRLSHAEMSMVLIKSIQVELFILAHEVAHILLGHPLASPRADDRSEAKSTVRQDQLSRTDELHADIVGYDVYLDAWPKVRSSYGEFDLDLSRGEFSIEDALAPLEYFKIMRLVENNPETVPDYGQNSNHPTASERADMILKTICYSPDDGHLIAPPDMVEACTETWHLIQSMPNIPRAVLELANLRAQRAVDSEGPD